MLPIDSATQSCPRAWYPCVAAILSSFCHHLGFFWIMRKMQMLSSFHELPPDRTALCPCPRSWWFWVAECTVKRDRERRGLGEWSVSRTGIVLGHRSLGRLYRKGAGLCSYIKSPAYSMIQHWRNFSQCSSICLNIIVNSFQYCYSFTLLLITSALGLSQSSFSVSGECSASWVLNEAFFSPNGSQFVVILRPSELMSPLPKDLKSHFRENKDLEQRLTKRDYWFPLFFLWFLLSFQF